jgi:L-threonylcarbamoyladenylate synthase
MIHTRIIAVDPHNPDPAAIEEAAQAIRAGQLVAFPTETVYGLGAHALDTDAVARIFAAKERPATDPLIVHLAHIGQLQTCAAHIPPAARQLGLAFWAGPLTLILPKKPRVPDSVTAGLPSVALRVPSHRVARALLETAGVPIAAPSANQFSRPSPTTAAHVVADLDGRVDLILDGGAADIGLESTIVDCTVDPPVMRRPGGLTLEQIQAVVPGIVAAAGAGHAATAQAAPGQLTRHYAPNATLTLYEGPPDRIVDRIAADARTLVAEGTRVGILAPEEDLLAMAPRLAAAASSGRIEVRAYGSRATPERAAHDLYASLRDLDGTGVGVILASAIGMEGLGRAVRDRLTRAAEGRIRHA